MQHQAVPRELCDCGLGRVDGLLKDMCEALRMSAEESSPSMTFARLKGELKKNGCASTSSVVLGAKTVRNPPLPRLALSPA